MQSQNELKCSDVEGSLAMRQPARKIPLKAVLVVFAILLTAALGTAGWSYRYFRLQEAPPPPARQSQSLVAAIALDTSRTPANGSRALEPHDTGKPPDTKTDVEISIHPMEQFRDELRKALVQQLASAFPQLPDLNRETGNSLDQGYRDSVFQFLDQAEKASVAQQPAMLLAADFMLQALWCPSAQKIQCDQLRDQFVKHELSLAYSELGGGSYYQHDLLWRVWKHFPETDWGERAFVLLLDFGWDTSGTCAQGTDQFRVVIRQGESFLQQRPNSPYREFVIHLVGQAYATRWSLSNEPTSAMADYVDPKLYKEGSEQARLKAIESFVQILRLSPRTLLGEHARQILPTLRQQRLSEDGYRFLCVYD